MTSTPPKGPSENKSKTTNAQPPPEKPEATGLLAVSAAVHDFLVQEFGAKEVRVTKISPAPHGDPGWVAEAEILVPNLAIRALNLDLTQDVMERAGYELHVDATMAVTGFEPIDL